MEKYTHIKNPEGAIIGIDKKKALSFYFKIRNKVFPVETKRSLLAKRFISIILKPGELLQNFKNKLKKLIHYPDNAQTIDLEKKTERKLSQNSPTFDADINDNSLFFPEKDDQILVVDHRVPTYDMDSGSLRMYSLLGILCELGYKITFIPNDLKKIEPYTSKLQKMSIEVLYGNVDVEKYLAREGYKFTFVILSRPEVAFKHISLIRAYAISSIVIYDMVDLHWLRHKRAFSATDNNEHLEMAEHYKSMELFNVTCSDIVFAITKDEKNLLLEEIPEAKIEVIPNIHDVTKTNNPFNKRKDIMFIGAFLHHPNEDAVLYFVEKIFPIIKEQINDVKFFIVGCFPSDAILRLSSKDIIVTRYVKSVTNYFENSRVFVSPLRYGAGMKGKIGQSMAYGLPVVTTTIGAEGIGLVNGESALIEETPKKFAEAAIRLYSDEVLWNKISIKSTEIIQNNYSKEVVSKKLENVFNSIKQQKPLDLAHS